MVAFLVARIGLKSIHSSLGDVTTEGHLLCAWTSIFLARDITKLLHVSIGFYSPFETATTKFFLTRYLNVSSIQILACNGRRCHLSGYDRGVSFASVSTEIEFDNLHTHTLFAHDLLSCDLITHSPPLLFWKEKQISFLPCGVVFSWVLSAVVMKLETWKCNSKYVTLIN